MGTILLPVLVAVVAGLVGGALSGVEAGWGVWAALAAGWTVAALAFRAGWPHAVVAGGTAAALAGGWLLGADQARRALHPPIRALLEERIGGFAIDAPWARVREPFLLEGRLQADAAPGPGGVQLRIEAERLWVGACPEPVAGGVAATVGGEEAVALASAWTAGRQVRFPVVLRRPATYRNDGLPDQERRLARRGLALVGSVKSGLLVEVRARGGRVQEGAARLRAHARRALARIGGGASESAPRAVATAILIGDRAGLDDETERRLQEAGTYHVIAISGGNIAILAALVLGALGLLGLRGRAATVGVIVALVAYAFVTGGGPSVARATLMAVIYLAARLIDQRTAAVNAIVLAALLILVVQPLAIFDAGFWLTFGATGAIVIGVAWVPLPPRRWLAAPAGLLLASVCAELALMPVSAYVFERVTVAGLILNFLAIPCMTVVQVGALAVVALDPVWGAAAELAARATGAAAAALLESARLVEWWPWLAWRVAAPPPALLAAYYGALALLVWTHRPGAGGARAGRARAGARIAIGALACAVALDPWRGSAPPPGRLQLTLFDVGQGDAMLVTFPAGSRLLVDTGGVAGSAFDLGDRVLGPALRARGVRRLDYVALTHLHPDHAGGAARTLRDFGAREIWDGAPVPREPLTARLRAEAARAGSAWRTVQRGDEIVIDQVRVRVIHPPLPDWERQQVRNDDSIVLELRYGEVAVVLTGDIGRAVEADLAPLLEPASLVVLKVPHHGSATSSSEALLDRLRPAIALIGVGRGNVYGHPHPAVLERYARLGTRVVRTDRDGQIDVHTDGRTLAVSTYGERAAGRRTTPAARPGRATGEPQPRTPRPGCEARWPPGPG